MKAAFLTLGCKLNYAETSTYERGLKEAGWEVVPWQQKADLYIVNTCSVTATSDAKSRNLVRKVHRVNPEAKIFVTGCSAELRRADLESIEGVARVFGCHEKHIVVSAALSVFGSPVCQTSASLHPSRQSWAPPVYEVTGDHGFADGTTENGHGYGGTVFAAYSTGERTRSFLKVQDGCDNYCKYCTVPYARGESRNIPICQAVKMAETIASEGVKEIVLTGVNTGDFGRTTGESFLDLLKALNEVDGIERYRISSIEPNLLTEEIVDWIASGTKFQPHFHIPLQTGCDELLEAMGRHYDTAFFARKIEYVRHAMEAPGKPKVFFGIDVMVGLPGETPERFEATKRFIESVRPAFIHVFPYSRRPGTQAASMPGQISEQEKARRVAELEQLCARLHSEFTELNRGVREKVLFESSDRGGWMEGYTGNYIRIERPYDGTLVNTLVDVTI